MKKLARNLILSAFAFLLVSSFYKGIAYTDLQTLALAGIVFAVLTQFVKPILKLLALPFNLLTFGLMSVLTNIFILYLVTFFIQGFSIVSFNFGGLSVSGFILPAFQLTPLFSIFLASFLIGLIASLLQSLFK
ncbi:MAG: phage holin family protein [bacterium]|nr:phage holin family protein [bacterium]